MIDNNTLDYFRNWFKDYASSWSHKGEHALDAFSLKISHTSRVCDEIKCISESLGLSECEKNLSECVALFHDIARFEQYFKYGTFMDGKSEDHGDMGAEILEKEKLLDSLDEYTAEIILCAVKYHNKLEIPDGLNGENALYLRMLRDADKLDILKLAIDYYYREKTGYRNSALELELDDKTGISEGVLDEAIAGRKIRMSSMKSLSDFKILQMSWVNDLNFTKSRELFLARDYIGKIAATLPQSKELSALTEKLKEALYR